MGPARIAALFRAACAEEIAAPKPGNVHANAPGHGMTADDFLRSAEAAAPGLCAPAAPLGARVLGAVRATRRAVGQNTNLGIILLCAPLAMAAEAGGEVQAAAGRFVAEASIDDARGVFQAIVLASPGGLGTAARHDVRAPPTVPLAVAMAEAAERDRIARQYVTGFADVFGEAMTAYAVALERWGDGVWATLAAYLCHLAAGPDSHVGRKLGPEAAGRLRTEARLMRQRFLASRNPSLLLPDLLAWDIALKRHSINPGTSADLTVATLFAWRLRDEMVLGVKEH